MPVYKDKNRGTWFSQFRYKDWTGETKRMTKRGFSTKREAVEWEESFKVRLAGNLDMKMKDFIKIYEEEKLPRLKEVTKENKRYVIKDKILPYFGELPINKISSTDVIKWQNALLAYRDEEGKPYSKSYLKKIHSELSAIFNHAVRFYKLPTNPAAQAGNIGSDNEIRMKFWTLDEYQKFIETMMYEPIYYYCFQVLYWLGLREGEALALLQSDFDFSNKTVSITKTYQEIGTRHFVTSPKTAKSVRDVGIPDFLCEELKEFFAMIPPDLIKERIFFGVSKSGLYKHMRKGSKEAGVKIIRIHDLRHSHVSLLIDMGYSAVAIADRVGHESIHITYRYAHLFPDKQKEMVSKLDQIMSEVSKKEEKENV